MARLLREDEGNHERSSLDIRIERAEGVEQTKGNVITFFIIGVRSFEAIVKSGKVTSRCI